MAFNASSEDLDLRHNAADVMLCAFALTECTVLIEPQLTKYLRAVHRTALELAVPNLFGFEIGGFWLAPAQIDQLRRLPDCYPANEIDLAKRAVEAYLLAQTEEFSWIRCDDELKAANARRYAKELSLNPATAPLPPFDI